MDGLESVFLFLDYLTDTKRKRHLVGGVLMSVSLFFGGLAFTMMTIKGEEHVMVYVSKICIPMEGVIEQVLHDSVVLMRITACRNTEHIGRLILADLNYWRKSDYE